MERPPREGRRVETRRRSDPGAAIQAAGLLREARLARKPFAGLPAELLPADEREGYAIQDVLNELLTADLGPVIGYKIGCTTPTLQAFMNIATPCAGAIFASTEIQSGGEMEVARYVRPGLECEVGVRLATNLDPRDGEIDRRRAASAIATCFTSIEIVDERYVDYRTVGAPTLIADDFMDAGLVRGPERPDIDPLTLDCVRGSTIVNGETFGSGVGSDVLGHPLEVLVWLAREMASRGRPLQAGTVVSLGSMVMPYFPAPGETVTITTDMLGEASLTVR